jgi:hypothetical protein
MALPVVAGAANPWAMADAPADGPAGVTGAQGQPAAAAAAAEGAEQPALALEPAPVLLADGRVVDIHDNRVARQQMEKYVLFAHCQFRIYRSVRDLACSTCCHLNHRYLSMARDLAKEKQKNSMLAEQMEGLRKLPRGEAPLEEQPGQTEVGAAEHLSA